MERVETIENRKFGSIKIENVDRIYEIDGRCLAKVTSDGYTTIYTGTRVEDTLRFWRVAVIKD